MNNQDNNNPLRDPFFNDPQEDYDAAGNV